MPRAGCQRERPVSLSLSFPLHPKPISRKRAKGLNGQPHASLAARRLLSTLTIDHLDVGPLDRSRERVPPPIKEIVERLPTRILAGLAVIVVALRRVLHRLRVQFRAVLLALLGPVDLCLGLNRVRLRGTAGRLAANVLGLQRVSVSVVVTVVAVMGRVGAERRVQAAGQAVRRGEVDACQNRENHKADKHPARPALALAGLSRSHAERIRLPQRFVVPVGFLGLLLLLRHGVVLIGGLEQG